MSAYCLSLEVYNIYTTLKTDNLQQIFLIELLRKSENARKVKNLFSIFKYCNTSPTAMLITLWIIKKASISSGVECK